MTDYTDFSSVLDSVHNTYPATQQLQLTFNNFVVTIFVNSKPLAARLGHYFSEFVLKRPQPHADTIITVHDAPEFTLPYNYTQAPPTATQRKIKHEYVDLPEGRVVHHLRTGMHYLIGSQQNCIIGPCLQYKNQVVNFINSRFISNRIDNGYLLGHAAGVTANGRGMVIAGSSGAGKSTLALHMLTNGADFVSNDRVLLHHNGGNPFYGTAQQPRINPGTAFNNPSLKGILSPEYCKQLEHMDSETLWKLEHKYDALIPEWYGKHRFIPHAPLSGVAIIDWNHNTQPMVLEELTAEEATEYLIHIMKKNDALHVPKNKDYTEPAITDYIQALDDTPVFIIRGGVDFPKATNTLLTFLHTGSTGA
ncbi:HprK-related kinase B [Halodesulfovibrio sp.]|jgi:HprK-related kinase B|uniref:HprK-related kinase B n=1 Tax=Halodesulfovibrio sp. TaxID=1912772 RepID=UPI0025E16972|nr:HprK-related kinase B [Halodesulfovibrio sp.]MCT4535729.1 HprK-related kinase B [Halodesulfovibrio sp.]